METIDGKTYYTTDEVAEMMRRHIAEESERKDWYMSFPEGSEQRQLMERRNKALNDYFYVQARTSEVALLYETGLVTRELTPQEQKEYERYMSMKEAYYKLNAEYEEMHRRATQIDEKIIV